MTVSEVSKTIEKYRLIERGDKVLIAVSGGSDSLGLLYILNSLKKQLNFSIHIAHLDHMLRRDSHKDKIFVEKVAKKLDLPLTASAINVRALLRKSSQEEVARNVRFSFLFKVARQAGVDKIALGHTLDDQAETVLMRILRGSGLQGLSGIFPKRTIDQFVIVRPLIELSRREIQKFLKKRKIKYRTDHTNQENIYFRNRIRNRLLPLLEKDYNPNIKQCLANMAQSIALDYGYLLKLSRKAFLKTVKSISKHRIDYKLHNFLRLNNASQRMILRLGIISIKGNLRKISYKHINEIEALVYNRPRGSIVDLPENLQAIKKDKILRLNQKK